MLRPLKCPHIMPRVMGFQVIDTSGTPSVDNGCIDDHASVTDNAAGDASINLNEPFQRTPVAISSPMVASGTIPSVVSTAAGVIRNKLWTEAGVAVDGNSHVLAFGFDNRDTVRLPFGQYHTAKATRPGSILTGYKVTSAGAVTYGSNQAGCTLDTSTFTLALKNAGGALPIAVGCATGATAKSVRITSSAVNSIVVNTYDAAGSDSAAGFNLIVLSNQHAARIGRCRHPLQVPQRGPRLELFQITVTAGTPVITLGAADGTITDNGTGDFSITWTRPFKRPPIVVATAVGAIICTDNTGSSLTAGNILTFNAAGSAADPSGIINVVVLGYDDATEY